MNELGLPNREPAQSELPSTFFGVQVLRAIAAMLVVAFHSAANLSAEDVAPNYPTIPHLEWGNAGVDLFFVISGFVMVWTTRKRWAEPHAASSFLLKRITRVLPLYWLLTTAKIALFLALPALFRATELQPWNTVASYLLIPSTDAFGRINPVITAGWTLCFEMAFYYLFTISLFLRRRPVVFLTPLLLGLGLVGMFRPASWGAAASLIDPLLLEFLAGMWIAELTRLGRVRGGVPAMLALLVLCVGAWMASGWLSADDAHAWRALVWGAPAALVLYAAIALEPRVAFRRWRLPLLLGDASYSIYLTHVLVLPPVMARVHRFALPAVGQWLVWMAVLVVAAVVGVLVWWLVETRLTAAAHALTGLSRRRRETRQTQAVQAGP